MKYLQTDVRLYKDTNSRGDYYWMSCRLFNDKSPEANPTVLPIHFRILPVIVDAFRACTDALTPNPNGWTDIDLSKVPDEGLTKHHIDNLNPEVCALDGYYQQIYRRDYTDANGTLHPKGSVRVGRNGMPLAPVNALRVYVQYYEGETFVDGMKVTRWMPVSTKEEIVQGVLERGYRKLQPTIATSANIPMAEDEPEPKPTPEDVETKKAALKAQLEALG